MSSCASMTGRGAIVAVSFTLTLARLAGAQDLAPSTPAPQNSAAFPPEPAPAPEPAKEQTPPPAPVLAPRPATSPEPLGHPVGVPDAYDPEEAPDTAEEPEGAYRRWYGWQTLIADGAALALVTQAVLNNENAEWLLYTALADYVFASPIIHMAHGNPGRSFGSLGLRVGVPFVAGVAATSDCGGDYCGLAAIFFGGLGVLAVMGLDAGLLAYEDPKRSALRVVPVIAFNPGMTYVGAGGAF